MLLLVGWTTPETAVMRPPRALHRTRRTGIFFYGAGWCRLVLDRRKIKARIFPVNEFIIIGRTGDGFIAIFNGGFVRHVLAKQSS